MSYIESVYKITDDLSDDSSAFDGTFILLLVFALTVRLFQSLNTQIIQLDAYTIIKTAKTFGNMDFLSPRDFAVGVHPLYPFLIALVSKCGIGYEGAAKALSILFGTLTLFPVYLMSKDAYGRKVGRYSAFLFAIHPYLFINASYALRDSTTIFFMVTTFFIAWKGFKEKKDRYLALSGCTAALAYLTKAEGLFCVVAIFLFIWMRDPCGKEITVRRRLLSTISFASISLTVVIYLIVLFSLKEHSFSLSPDKPFSTFSSLPPGGQEHYLNILKGFTTGFKIFDMALAFFLDFFEAIFTIYIFLLGLNIVRIWTGNKLLNSERYYIFIIVTLLVCDFVYFGLYHLFCRRYFLTVVALLMGFIGYGMRLMQAQVENLFRRRDGSVFIVRALMVIFVTGMITIGLIKGSWYWESKKASLKIAGRYILSHSGTGRTILTDNAIIAYYADGSYHMLTEDTLRGATSGVARGCPYDFIVFTHNESLLLYEKYALSIADSGFIDCVVPLPPGSKKVIIVECSKK